MRKKKKKKVNNGGPLKKIFPKMKIIVKSTKTISFDESESSGSDVTDDKSEKPHNSVVIEETASDNESSNDDGKRPLK
jgi:hypothetical protein